MEPSTCRSLAFLLSLGTLPLACKPEPGDTTDGGTDGTSSGTDSAGSTDTPTTATTDGSGTPDPGNLCQTYVALEVKCDPTLAGMEPMLLAECQKDLTQFAAIRGPACVALLEQFLACRETSCDEKACAAEAEAVETCYPEPGEVCQAFGAKQFECFPTNYDAAYFAGYCQYSINYGAYVSGAACSAAFEEQFACLSALSCGELQNGVPCSAEDDKVFELCAFGP